MATIDILVKLLAAAVHLYGLKNPVYCSTLIVKRRGLHWCFLARLAVDCIASTLYPLLVNPLQHNTLMPQYSNVVLQTFHTKKGKLITYNFAEKSSSAELFWCFISGVDDPALAQHAFIKSIQVEPNVRSHWHAHFKLVIYL